MNADSELDRIFPRDRTELSEQRPRLGVVVGGSLSKGLAVKLDAGDLPGGLIEQLAVGRRRRALATWDMGLALEKAPVDLEANRGPLVSESAFRSTLPEGWRHPLVSELARGVTISVGEPFYNQVNGPLFLALIFRFIMAPTLGSLLGRAGQSPTT